jgi:hypothetical protein
MSARVLLFMSVFVGAGCSGPSTTPAPTPAPTPSRPLASAPRYQPPPDTYVRSLLLNFDSPDDVAFIDSPGVRITADPETPSNRVLLAKSASIKLDALMSGRPFPGRWDLLALKLRGTRHGAVQVSLSGPPLPQPSSSFKVTPDQWSTVWFDLSSIKFGAGSEPTTTSAPDAQPTQASTSPTAPFILRLLADQDVLLDEVALAQSATQVASSTLPQTPLTFLVRRKALQWQVLLGGELVLKLPALPFVADGYRVVEANATRVLFATAEQDRTICIDRTGRLIENGKTRLEPAVMKHAKAVAENASPAKVEVSGEGRVERSLPGDRNNDGFDETRGVYTVRAAGNRVTVRLTRQNATVRWPVIEVYDLPAGAVSAWLEGQVLSTATRLPDGRVVLELPIQLERPTTVQITSR